MTDATKTQTNRRVKLIQGRNRALGGYVIEQREDLLKVRFDDGWIEWVREMEVANNETIRG